MIEIIINPTRLDEGTKALLQAFLDICPQTTLYAGQTYNLELRSLSRKVTIPFHLTHPIFLNSAKKNLFRFKIEIFNHNDDLKGRKKILGTLDIDNDLKFQINPTAGKNVKKVVSFFEQKNTENEQENIVKTDEPLITINPTRLDNITKPLLQNLIDLTSKVKLSANKVYYLEFQSSCRTVKIPICLTHCLLIRPGEISPSQKRVAIFGHKLGVGAFGQVYDCLGFLEVENDFLFQPPESPENEQVIKVIALEDFKTTKEKKQKPVIREAFKTNLANDFFRCKPALFSKNAGYLVMNKAPGEELFSFIDKLRSRQIEFSIQDYLKLTLILIMEVHKLHAKGLVHRDLKPENIMFDRKTWRLFIVDNSSLRQIIGVSDRCKFRKGTNVFMAPEALKSKAISQFQDIYALGLIIAQLWGDTKIDKLVQLNQIDYESLSDWQESTWRFCDLYEGMDVPSEVQNGMNYIIYGLSSYATAKRMSLRDAFNTCNDLFYNTTPQKPSEDIPSPFVN